jgi:hypothetical protein
LALIFDKLQVNGENLSGIYRDGDRGEITLEEHEYLIIRGEQTSSRKKTKDAT